ncbi:NAD(P)-binding domain-containing protein [Gemmata sp. G18]|uniref:NAD(P)-binding domain-containing protein n=1 Tax=Gemmata palustris TaxID=2822762 RepID=A0ABS5BJE9_9BACT|nr:NAD(P)-binding domain-containing protein [Gemmata palustris]MBP3953831.1 NAD(P)-binding domain-containing protein [Gemmata palustris]
MLKTQSLRIAIIGAGPIGIEAALYAKACGFTVAVFDRGPVGEHVRRWGHARMFTPFGMNATPLGLTEVRREKGSRSIPTEPDLLTGREFLDFYLLPLAESETLLESLNLEAAVLQVGRAAGVKKSEVAERLPFRLLVRDGAGKERIETADAVLDCTGTYITPYRLGDGNIPAVGELAARPHIAWGLEDILGEKRAHYANKSIILVGDGYSAASAICALATLAEEANDTWVFWLTRGPRGQPLPRMPNDPLKERDRLATKANSLATRCDGHLEFHPQTVLDEVICHGPDQGFRVAGRSNGKPVSWEVERVIANVGYRADLRISDGLRVNDPIGLPETGESNYFILGAKSYGRNSGFLLRDGFDQIRRVFATLTGNARLDHYAKKAA